jgi:hypothetical protein
MTAAQQPLLLMPHRRYPSIDIQPGRLPAGPASYPAQRELKPAMRELRTDGVSGISRDRELVRRGD